MTMPEFAAEASLYTTGERYRILESFRQADGAVYPALTCDQTCLDDCIANCPDPSDCEDLPTPAARQRCIRWVARCYFGCRRSCCH